MEAPQRVTLKRSWTIRISFRATPGNSAIHSKNEYPK